MSTSVGVITLDFEIAKTIVKQVNAIAKSAEKPAQAAFKVVGDSISKVIFRPLEQAKTAVKAPMDAAKAVVGKSMDGIDARLETSAKKVKSWGDMTEAELSEINPEFRRPSKNIGETTLAWKKSPAIQPEQKKPAPKIGDIFKVAVDNVGLLNQKLDITYAQLGEQEAKLQRLMQQYAAIAAEKGGDSGAAKAVDAQITAVQSKLISLQQTAMQTQAKLDKATAAPAQLLQTIPAAASTVEKSLTAAAKKPQPAFTRLGSVVKSVGGGLKSGLGRAAKSAASSAGKSVSSIGQRFSKLGKSVQSAFKSAFLMAGLYAAFRGIKSLIGGAVGQNEEFAKSLNLIKANLLTAFTPIAQAIQPALNALAGGFAAISKQVATATAGMFGQTYAQAVAATKKMQGVSKDAKKASGTLAGIDELNTLGDGTETDVGALDTAKYDDVAGFGPMVTDMLSKLAAGIGPAIAGMLGKIAASAPKFIAAAVTVIKSLLSGFNANFPAILTAGISILTTLLSGLRSVLPELGPFVVNVIDMLLQAFLTYAPKLFEMGVTLLTNVIGGLADRVPQLVPMAQEAIRTIINALVQNLPLILQSGADILVSLANGIAEMLPELIPVAIDCILTLIQTLLDNLPQIIQAAIDIIMALAFGIVDALPILLEKAPAIIKALVDGIVAAIPMLIDAAIELIMKLVDFLINNLDLILTTGPKIVIALAQGLVKAIPQLVMAIPKLIKAIIDKFISTDWGKVGMDIIKGIGNGLVDGIKNIGNTIKDAATGLIDGFKGILGIHSPSRVFADVIGKNMALGVGAGFVDEMGAVEGMMSKVVPDLTAAVQAPALGITGNARAGYATAPAAPAIVSQSQTSSTNDTRAAQVVELLMKILAAVDDIDPQIILDGKNVARGLYPYIKDEERRKGTSVVKGV